jgi:hypothetical protein
VINKKNKYVIGFTKTALWLWNSSRGSVWTNSISLYPSLPLKEHKKRSITPPLH